MSKHAHHWIRQNQPGKPNVEVCEGCGVERAKWEADHSGPVPAPLPPPAKPPRRKRSGK